LFLLVIFSSLSSTAAQLRKSSSPFTEQAKNVKPKRSLSVEELSDSVFEELNQFHNMGVAATLQIPHLAVRVHRLVVEGSADEGQEFDKDASGRALVALKTGSDRFLSHISDRASSIERHLQEQDPHGNSRELLSAKNIIGIVVFTLLVTFLIVLVVTNLIAGTTTWPGIPVFTSPPDFLSGTPGIDYRQISPCNRVPLQITPNRGEVAPPNYSYLPVTGGFIRNIIESASSDVAKSVVSVLESLFTIETILGNPNLLPPLPADCLAKNQVCKLTSECCTSKVFSVNCADGPNDQQFCEWSDLAPDVSTYEPFCALWSTTEDDEGRKRIDTFAFVPKDLWPPIKPFPGISLLPLCPIPLNPFAVPAGAAPLAGCKACEFILGFPITEFVIGGIPFQLTIQWGGVALSWADNAKLAFGTNVAIGGSPDVSTPQIWDGFREFDLPEVPDINFWTQFTINIVPLPAYTLIETRCKTGGKLNKIKAYSPTTAAKELYLKLDFEIYIGFDKQTYGTGGNGNATETAETLATDLGTGIRGRKRNLNNKEGQMLWRDLQDTGGEDPCVIISMTAARIKMPLIGTLFFGNGIGGFCNFSPEESGVRCTPSGFFFNLKQEFKIEGGLLGLLSSVLSDNVDLPPSISTGNSIGIFQNDDGENEAVVFRLEFPVTSLFGVSTGSGRPFVHFQLIKGSEVERRRQTVLRTSTGGGPWIPNCAQVDTDCKPSGWSSFYKDQAEADLDESGDLEIRTQICSDILLNLDSEPDKLLYYNRIMTAEPLDPAHKYRIEPPAGSSFKLTKKYDFENNPDANIIIAYMGISDISAIVISIRRLSVTLIFSDRAPTMDGIDQDAFDEATDLFNGIRDLDKLEEGGLWHPPDAFNFPDLSGYIAYLPVYDEDRIEILNYNDTVTRAEAFNDVSSNNAADQMAAFVRIFCQITVLFAADIQLGFIMTNFADVAERDASLWAIVGQFNFELLGLEYDFVVETTLKFDSRRRRHLLEETPEDYERALAEDGIANAAWDVSYSMSCVPDTLCEAFVEFFEDVGEAIWDGMVAIGNFFVEDLGKFASDAIAAVGEWGRNLIGGITDFADEAANFIADQFKNGEVAQIVNGPRLEAFGDDADKIYTTFTDGKFTINDIVAIGDVLLLAVDAIGIAFDLLVAGITDVVNAIGAVFLNVAAAVGDFLFGGEPWDELRTAPAFASIYDCKSVCRDLIENDPDNVLEIKRSCWCMDELECPVKPPEKRRCNVKSWCFSSCTECNDWAHVEVENTNTDITDPNRFPRFAGRQFDEGCRKERMADIAIANNINNKMDKTGKLVDGQFNSNIMGLSSFSPSTRTEQGRRLRRLQNQVENVSLPMTKFISKGAIPDQPVRISGQYSGVQLSPVSTTPTEVSDQQFESMIDLSDYNSNPLFSDDENYKVDNGTVATLGAQRGASVPFLGELKLENPDYLDRQPIVEAPVLSKLSTDRIMLDCTNARIAEAWRIKLQGSDPESLRRRRTRRHLQVGRGAMTFLETTVEGVLMNVIKAGGVLSVSPGSINEGNEDIFKQSKKLLGTTGAGSFLDRSNLNRRRRLRVDLADYEMEIKVIDAEAQSDRMYWRFAISVSDTTGISNMQEVDAEIMYGAAELANAPLTEIQTRCDTSPYLVDGLENDRALKLLMNETTFKAELRLDNCPNPFLYIEPFDEIIQVGVPCTKTFARIKRSWNLMSHDTEVPWGLGLVTVPDDPMYIQTITRGGLVVDGSTGVPEFALKDAVYFLPNEPNAKIATAISDFYKDSAEPRTECGFCAVEGKQGIMFSHPQDFDCSDVGKTTTISITTLNSIGEGVTKTANVVVLDQWGPNIKTKSHTVYLNQFGWLNETDRVAVADIDDATWDNCGIESRAVYPTPLYECGDEGVHTTTLTVADVNGNVVTKEEVVIVDDSSRLGIGDDEILDLSRKSISGKLVKEKMKEDFGYKKCKAIAVYVRPGGESNFKSLEYSEEEFPEFNDFEASKKWNIPKCKDDKDGEELRFHQALCGNFNLTGDDIGDMPCEGEIKVEVLCKDEATKSVKKAPLAQTCYRAKLSADNQCAKRTKNKKKKKRNKKKNKHNTFSHLNLES
jgi:hypothetical protein